VATYGPVDVEDQFGNPAPASAFTLHASTDTSLTAPLAVTDLVTGNPIPLVTANAKSRINIVNVAGSNEPFLFMKSTDPSVPVQRIVSWESLSGIKADANAAASAAATSAAAAQGAREAAEAAQAAAQQAAAGGGGGGGGGIGTVTKVAGVSPDGAGNVPLTKTHLNLGLLQNIAPADMPVSIPVQEALVGKAAASHTHSTSQVGGLDTAMSNKVSVVMVYTGNEARPAGVVAVDWRATSGYAGGNPVNMSDGDVFFAPASGA
jgi:hypothetical protein